MTASSNEPGKQPSRPETLELEVEQSREALADTVVALRRKGAASNVKRGAQRELQRRAGVAVDSARERRAELAVAGALVLLVFLVKRKRNR